MSKLNVLKKLATGVVAAAALSLPAVAADNALWEKSTLNQIVKSGKLRVGLEAGYLPFEMKDKAGNIVGFDVDMAKLMAKAMGVELELVNTGWDGIIPALLTDKFDMLMSGMTITAERNLKVNFTDPYIVVGQSVILSKKLAGTVTSYRDLNNPKYTIASKLGVTGDLVAKRLLSRAKLNLYETEAEGSLEVMNGNADAFIYDFPYNAIFAAENSKSVVHLSEPFTYEPLGIAIRKGDPDFLNWINNFLRQIKGDGTYDRIYAKWFESDRWKKRL